MVIMSVTVPFMVKKFRTMVLWLSFCKFDLLLSPPHLDAFQKHFILSENFSFAQREKLLMNIPRRTLTFLFPYQNMQLVFICVFVQ